jgi:MFS family permease
MTSVFPARQGWRLASLSLAMLLPSLGISVANIALPSLRTAFGVTSQEAQWVVIAYLVVVTSSLVTAGRLGDLLGRKLLLLVGIAIFSLASVAAVFSSTIWMVVLLRAIQGVGAAVMMSLTVAAVSDAVPAERSGTAIGLLGTVSAIGTAAGPSLGGFLVGMFGWSSIFVLMAGVGLLALLLIATQLSSGVTANGRTTVDLPGASILMLSVAAFALATTLSPVTTVNGILAAVAVLGAMAFVYVERRASAPLVQLGIVARRAVAAGLLSIGLVSAIVMTTLVVGAFYLTGALGLDTASAGLVMTIGPAVSAIVGLPAGRLVDRNGANATTYAGLFALLAGTVGMMVLPGIIGLAGYICSLVLITSGYALFQAANNTALMAGAQRDQRGVTSALLALGRNVGLITGASAMGALFTFASGGTATGGPFGLQVVFAAASAFVVLALALSAWAARSTGPDSKCRSR